MFGCDNTPTTTTQFQWLSITRVYLLLMLHVNFWLAEILVNPVSCVFICLIYVFILESGLKEEGRLGICMFIAEGKKSKGIGRSNKDPSSFYSEWEYFIFAHILLNNAIQLDVPPTGRNCSHVALGGKLWGVNYKEHCYNLSNIHYDLGCTPKIIKQTLK